MKKVLFVVHTLQVGGAEKVLVNLLKYIFDSVDLLHSAKKYCIFNKTI